MQCGRGQHDWCLLENFVFATTCVTESLSVTWLRPYSYAHFPPGPVRALCLPFNNNLTHSHFHMRIAPPFFYATRANFATFFLTRVAWPKYSSHLSSTHYSCSWVVFSYCAKTYPEEGDNPLTVYVKIFGEAVTQRSKRELLLSRNIYVTSKSRSSACLISIKTPRNSM